jgi:DNA-binding response OmpR family regulator
MESLPILIAEDDQALRILLSALFTHHGLSFEVVANGEHAIECIRRKRYSAILLDLMLPGWNGFEVIQYVHAERPSLMSRIIVMTAASNQTLHHFDVSSVGALLRKPFDIDELLETINRVTRTEWPEVLDGEMMPRISSYRVH